MRRFLIIRTDWSIYKGGTMNNRNCASLIAGVCSFCILIVTSISSSQSVLDPNAKVEMIASGILQPEGPVWQEGLGLLFSDIKGNKIYKWTAENGKEIYHPHSDSTNGLTFDLQGRLVAGQMGLRRVVRFEKDGSRTALADRYEGKRFNSPNDLVVKSDGAVFFTDPDFNIPSGQPKELSFNGIYRIGPAGNLTLLATLTLPNGICFSPDETKLYVNDSQAHKIYVWDVVDDSTLSNKKLFYTIPKFGYADGMKVDQQGNVYCTCASAVWVISPAGVLLGQINLPQNASASNCAWGDTDRNTLFITAGTSVYKIRPLATAVGESGRSMPAGFQLDQNYPNPFNPITRIAYSIPMAAQVLLQVYDMTGKEVATIEDAARSAGTHLALFNAAQLASGVYYYRLTAGGYSAARRLVLIK